MLGCPLFDPAPLNDTRADYEQFEAELLAQELIVDAPAALTRFRVELGHLEGPLHLCVRCSPSGPATYWTRDLAEHLVE